MDFYIIMVFIEEEAEINEDYQIVIVFISFDQ